MATALETVLHCHFDDMELSALMNSVMPMSIFFDTIGIGDARLMKDLCFVCQQDTHQGLQDGAHLPCLEVITTRFILAKQLSKCPSNDCNHFLESQRLDNNDVYAHCPSCHLKFCPQCIIRPPHPVVLCTDMQRFDDQEPFVNDDPVETLGVLAELDTIGNELNMFQAENPAPSYYLHAALIELERSLFLRKGLEIHNGYHPSTMLERSVSTEFKSAFYDLKSTVQGLCDDYYFLCLMTERLHTARSQLLQEWVVEFGPPQI